MHDGAGEKLLQLHEHSQGHAEPVLKAPPADVTAAIAWAYLKKEDWPASVATAGDLVSVQPDTAAEVVIRAVQGLHTSGSSIVPASPGLHVLHQAHYFADAAKVGHQSHSQALLLTHLVQCLRDSCAAVFGS